MKDLHFITGGTGFVGRHLVTKLLQQQQQVLLLVRDIQRFDTSMFDQQYWSSGQLTVVTGDVCKPNLGIADADMQMFDKQSVVIWHLAANLSFYQKDYLAVWRTNLRGTKQVIAFANKYGKQLHYLSTAFVCGSDHSGSELTLAHPSSFYNAYEASKWQAEWAVRKYCLIPWHIARPSIILGSAYISKATACTFGYYRFCYMAYLFHDWLRDRVQANSMLFKLFKTHYDNQTQIVEVPWLIVPYPTSNGTEFVTIESVIDQLWNQYLQQDRANRCYYLTDTALPLDKAFAQLLTDMNISKYHLVPLPPIMFSLLIKLLAWIPGRVGKYAQSAQRYLPYLVTNYRFTSHTVKQEKRTPQIDASYLQQVNLYAKRLFSTVTFTSF